jgi:hypothetical protein
MIEGSVDLAPEEREELAREVGRLIAWIAHVLHLPWWAGLLMVLAVLVALLAAAAWPPKKRPALRPRTSAAPAAAPVMDLAFCGHCGQNRPPGARAYYQGVALCFTNLRDADNCFRLVTGYGHDLDGSCCRDRRTDEER